MLQFMIDWRSSASHNCQVEYLEQQHLLLAMLRLSKSLLSFLFPDQPGLLMTRKQINSYKACCWCNDGCIMKNRWMGYYTSSQGLLLKEGPSWTEPGKAEPATGFAAAFAVLLWVWNSFQSVWPQIKHNKPLLMLVCVVLHKVDTISLNGREVLCREREALTLAQEERVIAKIHHLLPPEVEALGIPIRAVRFYKDHGLA